MPATNAVITVGNVRCGNHLPLALIAGPCVMENERLLRRIATELAAMTAEAGIPFIFKASYDKANRSSAAAYRGPGLAKGLAMLARVKRAAAVPVLTDVHSVAEVPAAAAVADVLQVPAFLCRQTDLLTACAKTRLPVNVKKGQFLAPDDMVNICGKITAAGNRKILLTERGVSFGYHNLVMDPRSLAIMKRTGCPVVFDATHSVQLPGGLGHASGGQREFIPVLAAAAVAVGIAALFVEVHPDPAAARSDGPNSLALHDVPAFLREMRRIDQAVKGYADTQGGMR